MSWNVKQALEANCNNYGHSKFKLEEAFRFIILHQRSRSNHDSSSNCTRWIIFLNGCPRRCVIIQCGASNLAGPRAISIGMRVERGLSVGRVAFLQLSRAEIEPLKPLNAAAPWQIVQIISRSKSRDSRAFRRARSSEGGLASVLSEIAVPWYTTSNSVDELAINKCKRYYREQSAAPKTYLLQTERDHFLGKLLIGTLADALGERLVLFTTR